VDVRSRVCEDCGGAGRVTLFTSVEDCSGCGGCGYAFTADGEKVVAFRSDKISTGWLLTVNGGMYVVHLHPKPAASRT